MRSVEDREPLRRAAKGTVPVRERLAVVALVGLEAPPAVLLDARKGHGAGDLCLEARLAVRLRPAPLVVRVRGSDRASHGRAAQLLAGGEGDARRRLHATPAHALVLRSRGRGAMAHSASHNSIRLPPVDVLAPGDENI